jgi:hypothetical protein
MNDSNAQSSTPDATIEPIEWQSYLRPCSDDHTFAILGPTGETLRVAVRESGINDTSLALVTKWIDAPTKHQFELASLRNAGIASRRPDGHGYVMINELTRRMIAPNNDTDLAYLPNYWQAASEDGLPRFEPIEDRATYKLWGEDLAYAMGLFPGDLATEDNPSYEEVIKRCEATPLQTPQPGRRLEYGPGWIKHES